MHRTEGDNHLNNQFTNGPPATTIDDDWLNTVQEEISAVVEDAGLTLLTVDTDTNVQLLAALKILFTNIVSVPATATSTGTTGQIAFDASYLYICVATNTWRRVGISGGF